MKRILLRLPLLHLLGQSDRLLLSAARRSTLNRKPQILPMTRKEIAIQAVINRYPLGGISITASFNGYGLRLFSGDGWVVS